MKQSNETAVKRVTPVILYATIIISDQQGNPQCVAKKSDVSAAAEYMIYDAEKFTTDSNLAASALSMFQAPIRAVLKLKADQEDLIISV